MAADLSGLYGVLRKLFGVRGSLPPAIDYFYQEPTPQLVPPQFLKKSHRDEMFWLAVASIKNFSPNAMADVRIKLNLAPTTPPKIRSSMPSVVACSTYDAAAAQVRIERLDPLDRVDVWLHLTTSEIRELLPPVVLWGDRKLSWGMRQMGFIRARPKDAAWRWGLTLASVCVLVFASFVLYTKSSFNPREAALWKRIRASAVCEPKAYTQDELTKDVLARHYGSEQSLLDWNGVSTDEQLRSKEYVIICEARGQLAGGR
jgi:hypothetical protein